MEAAADRGSLSRGVAPRTRRDAEHSCRLIAPKRLARTLAGSCDGLVLQYADDHLPSLGLICGRLVVPASLAHGSGSKHSRKRYISLLQQEIHHIRRASLA